MNINYRISVLDTKSSGDYWLEIETDLCATLEEAQNAVLKQLKILKYEGRNDWAVTLTGYKYRWEDLMKFGRRYNETVIIGTFYPDDLQEEAC